MKHPFDSAAITGKGDIAPIVLIAGFNLLTLGMYVISPFVFLGGHVMASYAYVLLNIAALTAGYAHATKTSRRLRPTSYGAVPPLTYFRLATVFYSATFLLRYAYLLRYSPVDIPGMVQHLLIGFYDPQLGYRLAVDDSRPFTVNWSTFFFISIVDGIYFIIGFLSWRQMSFLLRTVFIIFLAIEIFYWIGRGTNFGVISLTMSLALARLLHNHGRRRVRILGYFVLFAIAVGSFSAIMFARSGSAVDPQAFALRWSYVDETSPLLTATPASLHTTILTIFDYLVQGYYYMSFAFDLDFKPTWFGGWNPAVSSLYGTLGLDIVNQSYIHRLEGFGIDSRVNWHSAYTWIANDVSFVGVPLAIYALGFCIGRAWAKAKASEDILSQIVFVLLGGSAIFLFANENYIGYYFYSFLFIFPVWLWQNLSRNIIRQAPRLHEDMQSAGR